MIIRLLGTGSAFSLKHFNTMYLLEDEQGQSLLFDAGGDLRLALAERNLSPKDIKNVYISHLHGDHIHGLEYLGFATHYSDYEGKPVLHLPDPDYVYQLSQAFSVSMKKTPEGTRTLLDYFAIGTVRPEVRFRVGNLECEVIPLLHFEPPNPNNIMMVYALYITDTRFLKSVLITSDHCYNEANLQALQPYYEKADLIFQDCETLPFKTGVHFHYTDLEKLPECWRKKMILTHYQDNVKEEEKWQDWRKKYHLVFGTQGSIYVL